MALLEVKNLGISFGGLRAVDQFEINIKKGQLYGLIGPNKQVLREPSKISVCFLSSPFLIM